MALKRLSAKLSRGGTFFRYLLTGATISLLDLTLFTWFSVGLDLHVAVANVLSTILAICVSYLINRFFVFRAARASWSTFLGFTTVSLFNGMLLQSLIIWFLVAVTPILISDVPSALLVTVSKVIAMGVGALANYFGYRLVFRKRER